MPAVSNLENPQNNATIVDGKLRVSGWAFKPFGLKEVKSNFRWCNIGKCYLWSYKKDEVRYISGYFNGSQCGFDLIFQLRI